MKIEEGLTFDDVLLVPKLSCVESRGLVDIGVQIGGRRYAQPVIPANMATITGERMAEAASESGLAILHRFMDVEQQVRIVKKVSSHQSLAVSVGIKEIDKYNALKLHEAGALIFCIDIAHGDSKACLDMISWFRHYLESATIIAGNVATGGGARRLWEAGAHIVKVGVGPGSLCTTRIETGNGVPQLTALMDVAEARERYSGEGWIIADGGMRAAGDIVKALCFADMVMTGHMFAGCEETPGRTVEISGRRYKEYVGSSTHKTGHVEGVEALVPLKGSYTSVMQRIEDGIRSGCSYQGVDRVSKLQTNPKFIRISAAGIRESNHHDVIVRD